ncbi:hypothetical protein [Pseudomonas fluorescens]|uniref:Uncharacterized protein n=1 Tax=Pseudomonas fluorescens TaxID=294 RepID=A0A944DKF4_PSEFL|nr:hypothetical protein [Pseudomonas fluorescens]MBT2295965.1 hypothetical protein [Pseudomonas fluorescens]MBT2308392.1 hypothetical protein [Pseudomonas fluorescens]MBT2313603.1 hypothetical protein [Pseudomonas fluorescens]MBT2320176.1 hypothetical protein [Pseudomonas fluorescens]MBT2329588.1 hypothetical protein [Pseudomonas fluorescens]
MSLTPAADDSTDLKYGLDTLFGRQTKSVDCQYDVQRLDDGEPPWFALHVQPPLPDDLEKAQIVVFSTEGRHIGGIVRLAKRLDDGSLRLEVEPD